METGLLLKRRLHLKTPAWGFGPGQRVKSRYFATAESRCRMRGALLIPFAKVHFVELPHTSAKEEPGDGPDQ